MHKKASTIIIGVVIIVVLVGICTELFGKNDDSYEVVYLRENNVIVDNEPLYISTICSQHVNVRDKISIYYFQTKPRDSGGIEVFLEPIFNEGKVIMERYCHVNSEKKGTTVADEAIIYRKIFSLSKQTSPDTPLMLLSYHGNLFGVIGTKAHLLYYGFNEDVPKELPGIYFGSVELITYEIYSDGTFNIL